MGISFDRELDAQGLHCPMPLVNARKEIDRIASGQILKIVATDQGSVADFQSWAKIAKDVQLVGQETESVGEKTLYVHYVKRI